MHRRLFRAPPLVPGAQPHSIRNKNYAHFREDAREAIRQIIVHVQSHSDGNPARGALQYFTAALTIHYVAKKLAIR